MVTKWELEGTRICMYAHFITNRESPIGTVHNQGGNMFFLDGHVEWQHWWRWIAFNDYAARWWNYDNQPYNQFWAINSP